MEQTEIDDFYTKSGKPEVCKNLFQEAMSYFNEQGAKVEKHQEMALLNHLSEMVKRDINHEQIEVEDKTVFNELSKDSIGKAKKIVNKLANVSEDEIYLLAVHFEVVNYNN